MATKGALANLDPTPILARLQAGESLQDIAQSIGVSRQAIHAWMLREDASQFYDVITMGLASRVADADERLDAAPTMLDIARAREQARYARMDLERRRPNLYGVRQQLQVDIGPDLGDMLRSAARRVATYRQLPPINGEGTREGGENSQGDPSK
jgi:transcriptional regulator with XRE-family HTH domain